MGEVEKHLALRNDVRELARVDAVLDELERDRQLRVDELFAARLCAHEAITNVISYAFEVGEAQQIALRLAVSPRAVTLEITDDGRPFDPSTVPPPAPIETAEARVGGRGVHLMRSFAKALDYQRLENRNRLTIVMARAEEPAV